MYKSSYDRIFITNVVITELVLLYSNSDVFIFTANKVAGNRKLKPGGSTSSAGRGDSPANQAMSHLGANNLVNEEYVSKFNFSAKKTDELSLTKGMQVLVLEMEGDGWWYGRDASNPAGEPGWFPSNYVAKTTPSNATVPPPSSNAKSDCKNSSSSAAGCICVVRTLYDFDSGNPEELAFMQNEMLDVVEDPPGDPEWWVARNAEGVTGLVPKNYVEVVPDASPLGNTAPSSNYDPVSLNGADRNKVS